MDNKKIEVCDHKYRPLGFEIFKKTESSVEAVAAVFCEKCSMFRTKILTFRREIKNGK
jgi:hypothetical protein